MSPLKVDRLKVDNLGSSQNWTVIGVSGSVNDYRMAYFINKALGIDLEKIEIVPDSDGKIAFYQSEIDTGKINVVANMQQSKPLFPKAKMADYLIILTDGAPTNLLDNLKHNLQGVGVIQSIFAIENRFLPTSKLKYFA